MNAERLTELAGYLDKQAPDSYEQQDCERCALESFRQCFNLRVEMKFFFDITED